MKNIDSLSNDRIQVYEISTHSIDGHILKAWYVKPRTFQKMGAIVKYGSYTESTQPELYTSDKYAFLTVDIRGHGKSKVESDRGFPGYLTDGVENKNTYIYKWAYWDAALFLDFIYTQHPQIDTNNIHLVGHSQGATLCVAAASLSNHTVKSCMLSAIFFADLANQFKLSGWPKVEFEDYSKLSKYPMKKIERNLSYFDIKNMANMLNTNVMLAFGLKDHVCNARICFAFFNQLKCPKSYILYPASGHSLPPEYELEKWNWLNKFTKNIKP
jgi:cephalosporin-C deacetylase-like acetyl esterase